MSEKVGSIHYNVTLDTREMIAQQRQVDRELKNTTKSLDGFEAKLTQVAKAVSALAAAQYLIAQSDAYTKLNAQLALATDGSLQLARAQAEVRRIAQEAQTDISGVGTLYARISTATKELGVSQQGVADITRTVALALKVSGAGAQESASATLQLSQAFASGVLRGEEFNAVSEAAPRLMKALADGIGVPIGQLRGMAEQGKLTSDVLANALPKALQDLEKEAQSIQTIGGAFQQLRNEVMLFVGEQANASGAAQLTASAITTLANNIDVLAAAAVGFAAAKLAKTLLDVSIQAALTTKATIDGVVAQQASRAAAIAETAAKVEQVKAAQVGLVIAREEMVAKLALANATLAAAARQAEAARAAGAMSFALAMLREAELSAAAATRARAAAVTELAILGQQQAKVTAAMTAAQTAQTAALTATTAATTLASRALGFLGGPIGAITTVLGLGATAWALWGSSAKDSEQKATEAVERSTAEIVADLDKQISKLKERNSLAAAGLTGIAKQETEAAKKLATLQGQIDNLMAGRGVDGGAPLPEAARVGLLQTLLGQYSQLAGKIQEVGAEQQKLEAAGTSSKLSQWMIKYASDTEKATAEIAKAKKELGEAFTPELEQKIRQKFEPPKKPAKDRFDEAGYLAGLSKDVANPFERINLAEAEALRKNQELLRDGSLSRKRAAEAATLIEANAAQDRLKILVDEGAQRAELLERERSAEREEARKLEEQRRRGQSRAQDNIVANDPAAKVELDRQRALEENLINYQRDKENEALYAAERVAINQRASDAIREIRAKEAADQAQLQSQQLQAYGQLFGSMADMTKNFAGKQNGIYKAMFAASKAFAIADAIIKIQQGIAGAAALPFPSNLPAIGSVIAATSSIISTMQGANYGGGRQYGGPVSAGSLYRVNETGRPEMFTAGNGNQYMMPTASGSVTPADKVGGGGGGWTINIHQAPPGTTATVNNETRIIDIAVGRAKAEIASEFSENRGQTWAALRGSSNVRGAGL